MSLLARFTGFIGREGLFTTKDRLLLAVSGGVDSVVLCELCRQAGYDFVLAHCNFQLRGTESARDEQFVRDLASRYATPVLVERFDTMAYATQHKVSIQVAARELRYAWFGEILDGASPVGREVLPMAGSALPVRILTAHHLDDNIETVLLKFFKGTGVAGLRGILPRQGRLVRPLLFARKDELVSFAQAHGLSWVEDSSNAADKYARNYLRNQVVPLLEQLYPDVVNNLSGNIARFREVEVLYHQAVQVHKKKLLEYRGAEVHIPVLKLKQQPAVASLVYEIAKPYGFTAAQTVDIVRLLDSGSGRYVASGSHRIIRNRAWLIIAPLGVEEALHVVVDEADSAVAFGGGAIQLRMLEAEELAAARAAHKPAPVVKKEQAAASHKKGRKEAPVSFVPELSALIDTRLLNYPLILRRWKAGDYFYPLGMTKKKKVARFLVDQKLSVTDKEKVWVLESQQRIVWVVGLRIDNRFRIDTGTVAAIEIRFIPASGSPSPAQ